MKKLGVDRSQVGDAIKKILNGNLIQSYTYNRNFCYKMKKNFENSNTDSYITHNETLTPLKIKSIDDFERVKESFLLEINLLKMELLQPNTV